MATHLVATEPHFLLPLVSSRKESMSIAQACAWGGVRCLGALIALGEHQVELCT